MSTRIVETPSNPANAEINRQDLLKIINDFSDRVSIQSENNAIEKTGTVTIPKAVMQDLVDQAGEFDFINIRFGVTLPNQESCITPGEYIGNQITAVLLVADESQVEKNEAGNPVIVVGFRAVPKPAEDPKAMLMRDASGRQEACCGNPR